MRLNVKQQRAFTLLEMLISVAIFALMAAMAYGGLSQVIRSSEQIKNSNQTLSELQFSLSIFEKDILQLTARKVRDEYGDEQPALKLSTNKLLLSRLGWINYIGAQRSHIQRVEYLLKDEKLIRRYWLTLDQSVAQEPIESVLMSDVRSLSFKLIDEQANTISSWPNKLGTQTTVKIKAIELIIEMISWGEVKKIFELTDVIT